MEEVLKVAKNCRHYAMCKIDFLGSGVCATGLEKHYVSFYPQGRMMLYEGLAEKKIPVTRMGVEIADSCNLCGKCDYQCYFVTELQPLKVMKALKDKISDFVNQGGHVIDPEEDNILAEIREIVGQDWASNDPAILYSYSHDLSPVSAPILPDYVVLPNSKEEISQLVRLFNRHNLRYTVRGNGTNLLGYVINTGVILDLNRMKTLEFDEKKWFVKTGPGVTAFDLQKEAKKRGMRINAAEPSGMICSNIMGSGVMSTFSTTYGINGDNYIDAEFVAADGSFFRINDINSPNLYAYKDLNHPTSPGICTSVDIRLHPILEDEQAILVPFSSMEEAVRFIQECSLRHIGLGISILGPEYTATFFSPTQKLTAEIKKTFTDKLQMPFLVLVIGDKYMISTIKKMGYPVIDQRLLNAFYLGLSSLKSAHWLDLTKQITDQEPFFYLKLDQFTELMETALSPSAEQMADEVDPRFRKFYKDLYQKPHMTDMIWLTMFRILSSRLGRRKGFLPILIYLPIDYALIKEITDHYIQIAEANGIDNEFGFITPIDHGKRCIYEFDIFFDYNDPEELDRFRKAATEINKLIDRYAIENGTVRGHPYVLYQGFSRKESLLYS